jgi:hypothetical protein
MQPPGPTAVVLLDEQYPESWVGTGAGSYIRPSSPGPGITRRQGGNRSVTVSSMLRKWLVKARDHGKIGLALYSFKVKTATA